MTNNRDYVTVPLNDGDRTVDLFWYVQPYDGLFALWEGRIERRWQNGEVTLLWRRCFRGHDKARRRTLRRLRQWSPHTNNDQTN